ncbi:MAG: PAS domain-containing sensor histidine kinase [Hyphomicrobiaceae bacterium]|nr:PAS domain-containing sensor histidine kinase [Hyphomicrobiaceae bacterium]
MLRALREIVDHLLALCEQAAGRLTRQRLLAAAAPVSTQDLLEGRSPLLDPSRRMFFVGLVTAVLSLISAFAMFLLLTGLTPVVPTNEVVLAALMINTVLILAMVAVVASQVSGLVKAWREKEAGARLHIRIVALFSVIAALPAILIAVGATVSFSRSLDNWFSVRVRSIIEGSANVARTYVEEHGQVIRTDVVNMARDIDAAPPTVKSDQKALAQLIFAQAGLRDLPAAYLVDQNGRVVVAGLEDNALPFARPTKAAIEEAAAGQVPLSVSTKSNRITAMTQLETLPGSLLYVSRGVSPVVLAHLAQTEENATEYSALRRARGGLKWAHAFMYLTISMTALLAAIWAGMWFAGRFVAPIRRLIGAAQQVSTGNLSLELPERRGEGDLRRLSQTFNRMTRELKSQRDALVAANEQVEARRRFMEAVLSGVSAGVLGLDSDARITLASRSAGHLLALDCESLLGQRLADVLPAFAAIHAQAADTSLKPRAHEDVTMEIGGVERTFAVRVTEERAAGEYVGSVLTFDDITELVTAQRTSAWADVARRIAHEIKNPLTPIQLSAERIRRKYGKVITEDRETFDKLTETIERQAGHIKGMVDEFAAFARMPKPEMSEADVRDAVQEPVLLFREAHPKITYVLEIPPRTVKTSIDRRLISQAVTNLVKNATEAIESAAESGTKPAGWAGRIVTRVRAEADRVHIEVIDNGTGLPKQQRARLLEPYVTTKGHKGTGLGLAMVQKITEQHGGTLALEDAPSDADGQMGLPGALIRITLPLRGSLPAPGSGTATGGAGGRPPLAASG